MLKESTFLCKIVHLSKIKSQGEKMRKLIITMLIVLVFSILIAVEADMIVGKWNTENNNSIVEITKQDDTFYGKIVWLKEPNYPADHEYAKQEKLDLENPDESKKTRKLVGLEILSGLKYNAKKASWVKGRIYDPESGKTYYCKINQENNDELIIRGSLDKWGLAGRTSIWRRVGK